MSKLLSGHSQDAHNVINGRVSKFCGAVFSCTVYKPWHVSVVWCINNTGDVDFILLYNVSEMGFLYLHQRFEQRHCCTGEINKVRFTIICDDAYTVKHTLLVEGLERLLRTDKTALLQNYTEILCHVTNQILYLKKHLEFCSNYNLTSDRRTNGFISHLASLPVQILVLFSAVVVVVLVWQVISWFHSCCGTSISLYTVTRPSSIIVVSNALPVFSSDCESHLIFGSNPVTEHSIFCGSELDWPTLGTTESSMVGSSEKYKIKIKCQVLSEEKNYTSLIKCNILHQLLSPV